MESVISNIIEKEWQMFQAVNHGQIRASCQEDPETFVRMRAAQFLAWSEEACRSYEKDITEAKREGRNLVEEKYIHMMAHCAPEDYASMKDRLPQLTPEHKILAQTVNKRLIAETKALREQYPFLNRVGRPLEASGDTVEDTSLETYQLGELLTYSRQTLDSLLRCIEELEAQGESLAKRIQLLSLQSVGFHSFEDAAEWVMHL